MAEVNYATALGNYVPQQLANNLRAGLDVNKQAYELAQQQNADKAIADNLDPEGNLSEVDFYKAAAKHGLTLDQIKRAQEYRKFQLASTAEAIQKQKELEAQGVDPSSMGRGTPQPVIVEEPKKPLTFSSLWAGFKRERKPEVVVSQVQPQGNYQGSDLPLMTADQQAAQVAAQTAAPAGGAVLDTTTTNTPVVDVGIGRLSSPSFEEDPNIVNGFNNPPPVVPERSYRQKVEDSYNPANDIYKQDSKKPVSPEEARFDFTPSNAGDKYQLYKDAAEQLIVKSGTAPSVPAYFKQVYDNAAGAVTPVPPNPALRFGEDGLAKYKEAQLKYEAELDKQDAIGMKAVNEEKKRIADYAQTQGSNQAAQTAQNLALEQRGWDRNSRQAVTDLGLDPNKVSPDKAIDLASRRNLLDETIKYVKDHRLDMIGDKGFAAQDAAFSLTLNNLGKLEGANTLGSQEKLSGLLGNIDKSVQKGFKEDSWNGILSAIRAKAVVNPQEAYNVFEKMLEGIRLHGVLASDLKAAMPVKKLNNEILRKKLGVKSKNNDPLGLF